MRQHQANARQRTSIVAPSVNRHRADSAGNRVRSDSQLTANTYDSTDQTVRHPVEPRSRTGLLPPIMVCPSPSNQTKLSLTYSLLVQNRRIRPNLLAWISRRLHHDFLAWRYSLPYPPILSYVVLMDDTRPHSHLGPAPRRRQREPLPW